MRANCRIPLLVVNILCSLSGFSQRSATAECDTCAHASHFADASGIRIYDINPRRINVGGVMYMVSGVCKPLRSVKIDTASATFQLPKPVSPLVSIHGNIQYDFIYRTLVDTPFYQKDFRQHTVRTTFAVSIRNIVPLQVTILHRNSNSPYFKDITDVSVQYRQQDFLKGMRDKTLNRLRKAEESRFKIPVDELQAACNRQLLKIKAIENWLASPARLQELVRERELKLKYGRQLLENSRDSTGNKAVPQLPADSLLLGMLTDILLHHASSFSDSVGEKVNAVYKAEKGKLLDSLFSQSVNDEIEVKKSELAEAKKSFSQLQNQLLKSRKKLSESLLAMKQEVLKARDISELRSIARDHGLPDEDVSAATKVLSTIRKVGIGRTWLDYSDLTVQNISVTGAQLEVEPGKFYFAVAAGKANYRYRDFDIKDDGPNHQRLYAVRAGIGHKEGNNLIATWYDGTRSMLLAGGGSGQSAPPVQRAIGLGIESRLQINPNQYIVGEIAKSSFNRAPSLSGSGDRHSLIDQVMDFSDHSNEAYQLKWFSYWPQTETRFSGYYRKTGANFQSFNLQPLNSRQEAYQLKFQQSLFNKRLKVDAGIRKNDFNNPFIPQNISSRVVFKTLQLTFRSPKYPFVSVGFAPSSQLTVLDSQHVVENQYNTLTALTLYNYKAGSATLISMAQYTKFFNAAPDTGFIYFNSSSLRLSQTFLLRRLRLETIATIIDQRNLKVFSVEQNLSWQVRSWLSLSGGITGSVLPNAGIQWGASTGLSLGVGKWGLIQLQYEKQYLPGTNRDLIPMQIGHIGYSRFF